MVVSEACTSSEQDGFQPTGAQEGIVDAKQGDVRVGIYPLLYIVERGEQGQISSCCEVTGEKRVGWIEPMKKTETRRTWTQRISGTWQRSPIEPERTCSISTADATP